MNISFGLLLSTTTLLMMATANALGTNNNNNNIFSSSSSSAFFFNSSMLMIALPIGVIAFACVMAFVSRSSNSSKDNQNNKNENETNNNINKSSPSPIIPISVNYHLTRMCNYQCGFCFHTSTTRNHLPLDEAKRGLSLLRAAGTKKINFAGGEPLIVDRGHFVGELIVYCKNELEFPSVSIVSNGSKINDAWMRLYGRYLDVLAISCDSFDEETNTKIGRREGGGLAKQTEVVKRVQELCVKYGVGFKINTVVNSFNCEENMAKQILSLNPRRWKVFQCLVLEGENAGENAKRDASSFVISREKFDNFVKKHRENGCESFLVAENNDQMKDSYLLLDENMCFLNCEKGGKKPSLSILGGGGVAAAMGGAGHNAEMFLERGGVYNWSKEGGGEGEKMGDCGSCPGASAASLIDF